ncbi:YbbR-like domain-containing protein [candidate division KSB1 bacterium]|nr:YbbR-like domain-containing protein [candidate division KSB1 bacterium]
MSVRFFKNYKVKIVALVFAILIWFFVVTENEYEHVIEIPVAVINTPPGKVILSDLPKVVKVKIKGTGKDLIALMVRTGARLNLDLFDVKHSKTFYIKPKNVFLSRAIGAIQSNEIIMPDSITVVLADFQRKKIPVTSNIKPKVAPGFTIVGDAQINPDSVLISGPQNLVSKINSIATEEVKFENLTDKLKQTIPLVSQLSNKINVSINQVEISLDIQKLVEITLTGVPVNIRNVPKNVNIYPRPSTLSLVLEGGGELLTQLNRNDIIAYLDYNRVKGSPGIEHPAVIEKPPGIHYKDVQPKTFKLVFEENLSN